MAKELTKTLFNKSFDSILNTGFVNDKKIKITQLPLPNMYVTIYLQASNTILNANKSANMTLIFNKNGEFTGEFQKQFNYFTSSAEISGNLKSFGKDSLLKQIKSLNSAQKYGNIYFKQGVSEGNKYSISLVTEANQITISEFGIEEQLSFEYIFEFTFKNRQVKPQNYSQGESGVVAFVAIALIAIVILLIGAVAGTVGAVVSAATALIIWLGNFTGFNDKI